MNKLFIITGTSSGIGRALAELLLKDSYVIGISRNTSIKHDNYFHLSWDLVKIDEYQIDCIIKHIPSEVNKVYLVNNAGIIGKIQPAFKQGYKDIATVTAINYTAPAYLMSALFSKLKSKLKVVINIGSGAANNPIDAWSTYCSSKAALLMYARCFQEELKCRNFKTRIFDIAPGVVDTAMQEVIRSSDDSEFLEKERFVALKINDELTSVGTVVEKLKNILENPTVYNDVSLSLRTL